MVPSFPTRPLPSPPLVASLWNQEDWEGGLLESAGNNLHLLRSEETTKEVGLTPPFSISALLLVSVEHQHVKHCLFCRDNWDTVLFVWNYESESPVFCSICIFISLAKVHFICSKCKTWWIARFHHLQSMMVLPLQRGFSLPFTLSLTWIFWPSGITCCSLIDLDVLHLHLVSGWNPFPPLPPSKSSSPFRPASILSSESHSWKVISFKSQDTLWWFVHFLFYFSDKSFSDGVLCCWALSCCFVTCHTRGRLNLMGKMLVFPSAVRQQTFFKTAPHVVVLKDRSRVQNCGHSEALSRPTPRNRGFWLLH